MSYETSWSAVAVFVLFVGSVLALSFYMGRKAKSAKGYYAAHGQINWFVNGVAFAGDYLSAASFLGICGMIAFFGYDGFLYSIGYLAGWVVALFVIVRTPEPVAAFENVGKAYLAFAREEPALYAAMFESGLALDAVPALQQASDRAFAVLRAASEAVAAQIPKESRPPALMLSLHMWAFAHGIASLFARGDAARRKLPMSADDLLEAGFLIYLQGVGSPPKR